MTVRTTVLSITVLVVGLAVSACASSSDVDDLKASHPPSHRFEEVRASRIFAGPDQYPPEAFAAYGLLAFRTRATSYNRDRYLMICNAYVAGLAHASELNVLPEKQMATVWPINSDQEADLLNSPPRDIDICPMAVSKYNFPLALNALKDAQISDTDGVGPFLLAWSPSRDKGNPAAPVLKLNLSSVTTYEQAEEIFIKWSHDIEGDPALWMSGWNLERLRIYIRSWVDKYGEKSLAVFVR